ELRLRIDRSYDEMRRLILLAAVFFLIGILVLMARLQVAAEDIFRWAPVIWLLGVVVAGTMINLFLQCAKMIAKKRKERRRRRASMDSSQFSSLFANIPNSFPCLAPPPHHGCCRDPGRRLARNAMGSKESLPTYADLLRTAASVESLPPSYEAATLAGSRPLMQQRCPVHGRRRGSALGLPLQTPRTETMVNEVK
ncbi:unnamed protein product, partial [Mesorhabditis spiculigera]